MGAKREKSVIFCLVRIISTDKFSDITEIKSSC